MFARSFVRAASKAPAMSAAPKAVTSAFVSRASFSAGAMLRKSPEVIAEREVPTSSYTGGEAHHSTLKIRDDDKPSAAKLPEERVVPLTRDIFDRMTPSMQKMTLFGKVVVVTGYASKISLLLRLCR
jgi:hypothetical protein